MLQMSRVYTICFCIHDVHFCAMTVLVQWIGVSKRSAVTDGSIPVPVRAAREIGSALKTLWLLGDDTSQGREVLENVRKRVHQALPHVLIATVFLRVDGVNPDDPTALKRQLIDGLKAIDWGSTKGDAKRPSECVDLPKAIVRTGAAERKIVLSSASGTPAKVAVLLAELSDALLDFAAEFPALRGELALLRLKGERFSRYPIGLEHLTHNPQGASWRVRTRELAAAPVGVPVLLLGPTGVGKSTVADSLHKQWWGHPSRRSMVAVNCAVLEPSLAAAELFGAKKGAYTDAKTDRAGYFRDAAEATHGTLFLDEFAELPALTQAKLLTAIEAKSPNPKAAPAFRVTSVGASVSEEISSEKLRLILATNRSLTDTSVPIREDLIARVSRLVLQLAPLRDMPFCLPLRLLEAIEQIVPRVREHGQQQEPAGVVFGELGFAALLDALFDPHREWKHNHRDVERLALLFAFAAKVKRDIRHEQVLRNRSSFDADAVRNVFAKFDGEHEGRAVQSSPIELAQWKAPVSTTVDEQIAQLLESMTLTTRYEATLLLHAWAAAGHNAAQAWRLLAEWKAFAPGRSARNATNASSAFFQRWKRIFGTLAPPSPR